MIALLNAVRDHLTEVHEWGEVGRRPDDVPNTVPWFAVYLTTSLPDGNSIAAGDLDVERDAMVHLKCVGTSTGQLGALMAALDARMRLPFEVPGQKVQLVLWDRTQGPEQDTSIDPDPAVYIGHQWWTVSLSPTP